MSILTDQGANVFLAPSPVIPQFLVIASISNTFPMSVVVTTENNYVVDQLVRFSVPSTYGMTQANGLTAQILTVSDDNLTFTVSLDGTLFDVFSIPGDGEMPATLAPAGSRNSYNSLTVPFHSEGNFGN